MLLKMIDKYYPGGKLAMWQKLDIKSLPEADKLTGIYLDEKGAGWVGLPYLSNEFLFEPSTLKRVLERSNSPHIDGLARNGHLAVLYELKEAVRVIKESRSYKRKKEREEQSALPGIIEAALDAYERALDSGVAISFREFLESFQDEE